MGGIKTAISSQTASQTQTADDITLSNETILFISTSMGLSLLVTAWLFYRVTGGAKHVAYCDLGQWQCQPLETMNKLCILLCRREEDVVLGKEERKKEEDER